MNPIKELKKLADELEKGVQDVDSAIREFYQAVIDMWGKNDKYNRWWDIVDVEGTVGKKLVNFLLKEDIIKREEIFIEPLDWEEFESDLLERSEWLGSIPWEPKRSPKEMDDEGEVWDSYEIWSWTDEGIRKLRELDIPHIKVNPERLGLK